MIQRRLAATQELVLESIHQAHPGVRDAEIAAVAGVDRTQTSKWRSGEREMRVSELVRLQGQYGAGAVFGPLVGLDGAEVRQRQARPAADLQREVLAIAHGGTALAAATCEALRDGLVDSTERDDLTRQVRLAIQQLERLSSALGEA